MSHIKQSALVHYSASQMYQLVNDVENYPHFIESCVGSKVFEESEHHMLAELVISHAGLQQSLRTRNTLIAGKSISMHLLNGPFKSFSGQWQFTPLDTQSCKIEFEMSFTVNNPLLGMAFTRGFKKFAETMVQSFTSRAREIYGQSTT